MKKTKKLVFATNNTHKLKEARQIFPSHIEIVSLEEIGCHDEIPETADTLSGNALQKAHWVKDRYGYDCFADDTGLMVDALDGAPGVYSARYAGEGCTPADNVEKLLKEMNGVENRDAHFSTVVALLSDGREYTFEGRVEGSIAEEPHGSEGFGYDPVFVEKESGKCFAEMSAEEKNAVSHRGRAMRKLVDFLALTVIAAICMLWPAKLQAAQWRLHPSFDGQVVRIVDTPKFVYVLGVKQNYNKFSSVSNNLHGVLFKYDKDADELTYLNSQNELGGNTLKTIAYNYKDRFLALAYQDGLIELLYDNGSKKVITGLKTADPSLDKIVNDFTFDTENSKIYAGTNFGILVIDAKKGEIDTSRIYNLRVNSATLFKNKLWLATDSGIYFGNPSAFNLSEFEKIPDEDNVELLTPIGDRLYFSTGRVYEYRCKRLSFDGKLAKVEPVSKSNERFIERGNGIFVITAYSTLTTVNPDESVKSISIPADFYGADMGTQDGSTVWLACARKGFAMLKAPGSDGKWTVLKDRFFPNASSAFQCSSMAYHPDYGMLVRNHGDENFFAGSSFISNDLISGYKDMNWSRLSTVYRTNMPGLTINNPFGLAIDPNNKDHVYCGSTLNGLLRLDLKDPEKSIHFSKKTDYLNGYGNPGFVVLVPDNPPGTWEQQCVFAAPVFDTYGNLWTAFVNPEAGQDVSSYTEMWVWPAAERAASTSTSNIHGWKKIKVENLSTSNWPVMLALSGSKSRNVVIHAGNNVNDAMLIYDHKGTLDNRSDDRMVKMKTIYDQDGESVSFPRAYALHEDLSTGLVWVSNGDGVFTFDPATIFDNPTSVRRIKVPRNDGTNLADYLLSGVQVNAITSDPSGRKWFGTLGAGLVCTSADGKEILSTYTSENSELPGENVYALSYNPSNSSMMISTENGLCELFLGASASAGAGDVRAYPNPVRPEYYGYVTIDGLPSDGMVKITDAGGNLIKEVGQAFNGEAEWDCTDMYMKRVPAGVYFIIASNGPDADSYNKVGKILVVN